MVNQYRLENREEKLAHLQSLENIPSINPKDYDPSDSYQRLDYIRHQDFGTGFVEEIIDRKNIRVFFPDGEESLVQRNFGQLS